MLFIDNAGYRLRFKFGLFVNFGVYGGYASIKSHWDYFDAGVGAQGPSSRDDEFTRPYLNAEVGIGFGF